MTDVKAFRRACYEAATNRRQLAEFRISDEPTPSFHQGIITYPDRTVALVRVRDTPLLAVAVPRVIEFTPARESSPLTFVTFPTWQPHWHRRRNSGC